ncbi:OR1E5 protein, partial [Polypterus senegalus]
MKMNNTTNTVSEFVLQCAIESSHKNITICVLTFIYFMSMLGNLLVILVIILNTQLHAPMYIYIGTLAVTDIANTSVLIPKMLSVLLLGSSVVPYATCVLQMFLVSQVDETESFLLALMAIDRYMAVVYPLQYPSTITNKITAISVLAINVLVIVLNVHSLLLVSELSFCRTNILPYCFCDYVTLIHVSCSEDSKYLISLSSSVIVYGVFPLFLILLSYSRIAIEALRISSGGRKSKVFSTCVTHLLVIALYHVPITLFYMLPGAGVTITRETYNVMFILGHAVPSMLNPVIYSFRNKEINKSIHKLFTRERSTL